MYSYARNLPTINFDLDGHEDKKSILDRLVAGLAGSVNMYFGSQKVLSVAPEAALAPETSGFTGVLAAYHAINGTGQTLTGAAQIVYAVTGNPKAEEAAKTFTAATTVSGMVTLAITGDTNKAAVVGSVENLVPSTFEAVNTAGPVWQWPAEIINWFFEQRPDKHQNAPTGPTSPQASTTQQPSSTQPTQTPSNSPQHDTHQQSTVGSNSQYSVAPNVGQSTGLKCSGKLCPK